MPPSPAGSQPAFSAQPHYSAVPAPPTLGAAPQRSGARTTKLTVAAVLSLVSSLVTGLLGIGAFVISTLPVDELRKELAEARGDATIAVDFDELAEQIVTYGTIVAGVLLLLAACFLIGGVFGLMNKMFGVVLMVVGAAPFAVLSFLPLLTGDVSAVVSLLWCGGIVVLSIMGRPRAAV